ncbi:MAG: Bax inhibitor-1/YccA family protein [Bacteroidales bacterium]|nr:Bax inhibitor-1/YccA family protein [Bacteroidales bacterium]
MISERDYYSKSVQSAGRVETKDLAKNFIANVFAWMGIALAITAFTAYYFAITPSLIGALINPETGGMTILGWIVMLAPIGFVLAISMGLQKFSVGTLILLYGAFSIIMGASLSFVLLVYTSASIFKTFAVTAGMFGVMSFVGYTTKTDLTKFGSLMFMGLIGIIIASVVNMFLQSGTMDYIISFIGVLVFTGLTAYDVQTLKKIGAGVEYGAEQTRKLVIMGALRLYLDFINLFLFLLRFLGDRR